ncbi:hypothetical protein ACKC9G_03805 [Pokkaliibacter sp. CJK22405]|uniref:hypothetical protein n=1 Tax=Pokkaliibacter sp. CJK22405 TaxID=3384615 RepID=UPI0039848C68
MSVWVKTLILIILVVALVAIALTWLARYRKQWAIRQHAMSTWAQHMPALVDALDSLYDSTTDQRLIDPFRRALERSCQSLRHYSKLDERLAREAEAVLALETQDKDEWLLLAKDSLREVEFHQGRFSAGMKALVALGKTVDVDTALIAGMKKAIVQLLSRMRVSTLIAMAQHLEFEGTAAQAVNCYQQALRELGRWRHPDAFLRRQMATVRESIHRLSPGWTETGADELEAPFDDEVKGAENSVSVDASALSEPVGKKSAPVTSQREDQPAGQSMKEVQADQSLSHPKTSALSFSKGKAEPRN